MKSEVPSGEREALPEPSVVAAVLNWCREEDTAACLRSLQASTYPRLRILLVDNGSPDRSGERLRRQFPDIAYLQTGENLGYAGGNNRAIEWALNAGAGYVLVLNNDAVVAPDCVSSLVRAAESQPRVGAVGPKILYYDHPGYVWFGGGEMSWLRAIGIHRGIRQQDGAEFQGAPESVTFLTGCCLLLPAAVLREVGGFREDFFAYVEDVDLSMRLSAAGYRLLYQPAARVLHREPWDAAPPSPFQILHRDRNRRRLVRAWYSPARRLAFCLWFYPTRVAHAANYLLRGDAARVRAVVRGMTHR